MSTRDHVRVMLPTRTICAVRHVPNRAVERAQPHAAQAHLLDGADGLADVDDVANAVLVLDEHEDAADEVLDERLGAKAERDGQHARAREQRRDGHAEHAECDRTRR